MQFDLAAVPKCAMAYRLNLPHTSSSKFAVECAYEQKQKKYPVF